MRFTAHDAALGVLAREEYYSVGGGFIVQAGAEASAGLTRAEPPYEFNSGAACSNTDAARGSKSTN